MARSGRLAQVAALSLIGGAALLALSGCAAVKPWEREKLASPCMRNPFGKSPLAGAYEDKLIQTKTAGGLPGDAPGGGCGCVQ
jgi:hypothetical protein